jgi:hypothetical protein
MDIGALSRLLSTTANAAPTIVPVTISSGQSLSSAGVLNGFKIIGFALPAAFTKAHLTFQASWNGTDYFEIFDTNRRDLTLNEVDLDADPQSLGTKNWTLVNFGQAGGMFVTGGSYFGKAQAIKIRSGTPEDPVSQEADRIIQIITMSHGATLQF